MTRATAWAAAGTFVLGLVGVVAAQPPAAQPVALVLEDQFDRKADLSAYRGAVVILVYGDRRGTDACKALGEQLHVYWHPEAKGQPPAKAQGAPVVGLDGLPPGKAAPDVRVIPVACCGKVPTPIRGVVRGQIARGAPDVPVWLDFTDAMKATFGLTAAEPNLVVFDAAGRLRERVNGTPDAAALARVVRAVQALRAEAAGL
ncbi:MAG TPA: hypothetical protein VH092_33665 [Urbifossiella sp.]|jgi:hypothetical protein|nr:hypothetical protein [Urbifossiella sp.]